LLLSNSAGFPISSQAFPPSRRLHYPREYRLFFSGAEVVRLRECTVFRIANSFGHYRLGITIKSRGRSIDRNRVKRQIREAFRHKEADLGSFDYNVVIPSSKKMLMPYPIRLRACLDTQLISGIKNASAARPAAV
jgi:ribonuclease P protein component